jgi:hypothetical protein
MIYEWEQEAKEGILPHIHDMNEQIAHPFEVWGVAVVNAETGEACYFPISAPSGEVFCADAAKDVMGDAEKAYGEAMIAMRMELQRKQRGRGK